MQTASLKKYFFAGATASLALVLFAWHNGYMTGFRTSVTTAATPQVTQSRLLSDTSSVRGRIADITGTTLTILAPDSTPVTRKVLTDQGTVFGYTAPKDPKTFQSDVLAFDLKLKTAQANGTTLAPREFPTPFTLEKLSLSDLRVGDTVTITAIDSILGKSEFVAMSVIVENRSSQ